MRTILSLLYFITFAFILGCNKNISLPSNSNAETTISTTCNSGINTFNKNASHNIIRDIKKVSSNNTVPNDLIELYPDARDAWNNELLNIKNNYSSSWTSSSLNSIQGGYSTWRVNDLNAYQKFFLALTEYRYGPYPAESLDLEKKAGWIEKADPKIRMEAIIKVTLKSNCNAVTPSKIRSLLNPELLPDNINDCLSIQDY